MADITDLPKATRVMPLPDGIEPFAKFFPKTVADHANACAEIDMCSPRIPTPTHDMLEFFDAIEGVHLREYQRLCIERIAKAYEGKTMPLLVTGWSPPSFMAELMERRMREERERLTLKALTGSTTVHKPIVWDIESYDPRDQPGLGKSWAFDRMYGNRVDLMIIDEDRRPEGKTFDWHHIHEAEVITPTSRAAKLINEKLGKQVAAPSPKIEIPADFKAEKTLYENRAARRRAGRKHRHEQRPRHRQHQSGGLLPSRQQ